MFSSKSDAARFFGGLLALCTMLIVVPVYAQQRDVRAQLASKELNERAETLLKKMTLEEKLGQLAQYSAGFATGPYESKLTYDQLVERGAIGSMLNVIGAEPTNHYQHIAVEKSRLHIPLIFGLDVIHGDHTSFPVPLAIAASWDPQAAETVARTAAVEARADGIAWVFSPMVDIARDARWGRIIESNGEDPYLSSALARAWVKGYQQDDLAKPDSVAACVKHFAAYGAAIGGRDYNAVDMSDVTLRQVYLAPYRAAVDAGVATVMTSFNSLNGVPATANPLTLTRILRKEWGFDGFVVSDWGAIGELMNHSIGSDGATVARKALEAGTDMDMESNLYTTVIASQVRSGKIPEGVVDEAVRRVLRVKFALGLFEHPYAQPGPAWTLTPERRALARKVAGETLVLLKNEPVEGVGTLLPLKASKFKRIALIGPLADDRVDLLGAWSTGDPKDVTTPLAELKQRLGDKLLYAKGSELLEGPDAEVLKHAVFGGSKAYEDNAPIESGDKLIAQAVETAKQADVAILTLGEPANWMEGEASSRAHLGFTGSQQKLLEAVAATGKPLILVVVAGRPLEITWAAGHVPAIVEAWSPGIEAGPAVADVLFGDVNPSGKLPASLPRSVGQEPLTYMQFPTGRPAHGELDRMPKDAAEKFQSRYMDEDNAALYPFGWGLSYTHFRYAKPTVSRAQIPLQEALTNGGPLLTVGVDVTNTGSVAGTEVVQLYVRNTEASVEQPLRELKGFARVDLAPGETKHVDLPLGFAELSFVAADLHRAMEATTYDVWVGGSSLATEGTSFKIVE
ncbi:MAG: beta-glucosidase BglX [Terracidiphilus sp.]|nr:beta-glucosidase BglX [Terracidiphilus sp.]